MLPTIFRRARLRETPGDGSLHVSEGRRDGGAGARRTRGPVHRRPTGRVECEPSQSRRLERGAISTTFGLPRTDGAGRLTARLEGIPDRNDRGPTSGTRAPRVGVRGCDRRRHRSTGDKRRRCRFLHIHMTGGHTAVEAIDADGRRRTVEFSADFSCCGRSTRRAARRWRGALVRSGAALRAGARGGKPISRVAMGSVRGPRAATTSAFRRAPAEGSRADTSTVTGSICLVYGKGGPRALASRHRRDDRERPAAAPPRRRRVDVPRVPLPRRARSAFAGSTVAIWYRQFLFPASRGARPAHCRCTAQTIRDRG